MLVHSLVTRFPSSLNALAVPNAIFYLSSLAWLSSDRRLRWSRLVGRVGATHARRRVVIGAAWSHITSVGSTVVTEVLLAKSCETLLLGDGVDVGADDEGHNVEEGDPELVREELLSKSQADRRGDPRDPHHLPEADLDGSTNLMVGASAGNESHSNEVDAVLDRSDLGVVLATDDTKLGPSNLAQVASPSFLRT